MVMAELVRHSFWVGDYACSNHANHKNLLKNLEG
jgi:hypothetical protein